MSFTPITNAQKTLLRTLIGFIEDGKLKEPIVPFPASKTTTQFVLHLQGEDSFVFKRISDMDSLCDAGMLRYRWNRHGTGKLYYVTEAGAAAARNDFQIPETPFGQNVSLSHLTAFLSSGQITLGNIKETKTVTEIAADPVLRHTAVTSLIESLQKTAELLLPWGQFRLYHEICQSLQTELLIPRPQSDKLQSLFSQLMTPQTSLADWPQLWAHLYPLLLLAQSRLS